MKIGVSTTRRSIARALAEELKNMTDSEYAYRRDQLITIQSRQEVMDCRVIDKLLGPFNYDLLLHPDYLEMRTEVFRGVREGTIPGRDNKLKKRTRRVW